MGLFIFNNSGVTEDEITLGKPDEQEAKSLKVHTAKCALRYSIFTRRMSAQGQDIAQIKYLIIGLMLLIFLTSPQFRPLLDYISKLF